MIVNRIVPIDMVDSKTTI